MLKPRIFISSVTRELASARQLVANTLIAIGYEPIWQDIFPTDAGDLREMLRGKIDSCSAVLQLVGDAFGAEPPTIDPDYGRVSYTQYEALYAESVGHKKKVYYLFLDTNFPRDNAPEVVDKLASDTSSAQYEERRKLQADFKERIRKSGTLRSRYSSVSDLESGIFKLRNDLDKLRRNTRMVLTAIFAILALVVGGVYLVWRAQGKQEVSLVAATSKLDEINAEQKKQREMLREFASALNQVPKTGENENPEQRLKTAYKVLEEKFKLPVGSLEARLQKIATDILEQDDAAPLDRANALVVQGKYADAEKEALKARDKALASVEKAVHDAVDALDLAGEMAFEQGQYKRSTEHFKAAAALLNQERDFERWSLFQNGIGRSLLLIGEYEEAGKVLKQNYEMRLKKLGAENAETAVSLNNLAEFHRTQGEYSKALKLYEEALPTLVEKFGVAHSNTLATIQNIASMYSSLGNFAEAVTIHEQLLKGREKVYGVEHLETAYSLTELGDTYLMMGENRKALASFERALSIREKKLGPEHPDVVEALNNLSLALTSLREFAKAEAAVKRAIAINEKLSGKDHLSTAISIGKLGSIYSDQGNYKEAIPLMKQELDAYEKYLGKSHVRSGIVLNNIGLAYQKLGDADSALAHFEKSLPLLERSNGRQHINTAVTLSNIGLIYFTKEQYEKALPYYVESYQIQRKLFGVKNNGTIASATELINTYVNLAIRSSKKSAIDDAIEARNKALELYEEVDLNDGKDAAINFNELGYLNFKKNEFEKAIPFFERAIKIHEKMGSETEANYDSSLDNLAEIYLRSEKYKESLGLFERLLESRTKRSVEKTILDRTQKKIDEIRAAMKKAEADSENADRSK